jgi:hypothetical protein
MKTHTIILLSLILCSLAGRAGQTYFYDASNVFEMPKNTPFKMGNPGPEKEKIQFNSRYMTLGGNPVLPVMGELQFSRVRRDRWEDCLLKMKACGVNIVGTYLFWNRHEEIEGEFDWEGEKDLRAFVQLCQKHELFVVLRLGPWAHGEARNGGTPDWILRKKQLKDRSNDVVYQNYVKRYFAQIAAQVDGLYYKNSGPIIGIQLENEYWYAKAGEAHIQWLKDTARNLGMDVPLYTVTGWGNGSVPPYEVIPLWGGYPDAPWVEHVNKEFQPNNFMFDAFRDNKHIGNDQIDYKDKYMSYEDYPYFSCEMGVGVHNTYHRRLVIDPLDGLGMITAKLGSGCNLLGYYIFAGATHFRGLLHSTNEEQEETGYWSQVPTKSYDFQAAIRESGELSGSYKQIKKLHYFVNEFGNKLAPMATIIAKASQDGLQTSVRSDNRSGFLFGINYMRYQPKKTCIGNHFKIRFQKETIEFPQKEMEIPDSTIFIWPLNLEMGKVLLKYATVQLIGTAGPWIFFQNKTIPVEMAFDRTGIDRIETTSGTVYLQGNQFILSDFQSGKNGRITLWMTDGTNQKIIVLTQKEADNCWIFTQHGQKVCYLTEANLYADAEDLYLYGSQNDMTYSRLNIDGTFVERLFHVPAQKPAVTAHPHALLDDSQWIEAGNFKNLPAYQQRYHRFFFKEFSLDNPSAIRKATLYLYSEQEARIHLNTAWVRQDVSANKLNIIDLTGYLEKGENQLFVDFPYQEGQHRFAARMVVEYSNFDRIEIPTDASWLTTDMYTTPSPMNPKATEHLVPPVLLSRPEYAGTISSDAFMEWNITVPRNAFEGLSDLFLHLRYQGDRAELYNGSMLSADHFNNNVDWQIGLLRQERSVEGKTLRLVIYKLAPETKIFFDIVPKENGYHRSKIEGMDVVPEYKIKLNEP